jgi:alkylation response protein AidB-like acyl-CoA dehydrogenase
MGLGLRALTRIAGSELLDRVGARRPFERALFHATRNGFRSAGAATRTFKAARKLTGPVRQSRARSSGLFDLTPEDEQRMLQEAVGSFAADLVRPAAADADEACAAPPELLAQALEIGVALLGVPEEMGGVMPERSAVTGALVAEALAHGDMGIATAALAPGAVATALGLWGDADQQAAYLPAFTGDDVPAAAVAILEPRPVFDPLEPAVRAVRDGSDWVLSGVKSLVPRVGEAELFVVAARAQDMGPALFILESSSDGLFTEPEPAMGLRAAATGRLVLDHVRAPAGALLGAGDPAVYAECVQRGRLAWCALSVGAAQAVLDYAIPYVNGRIAFGEPISHRQAVAFAISEIGIELEGMRLATYRAASRADRGEPFAREAAVARRLCATHGMRIGSDGVQLLGGHGYVKEHPVERWYRDLRAAGVMEGALLV